MGSPVAEKRGTRSPLPPLPQGDTVLYSPPEPPVLSSQPIPKSPPKSSTYVNEKPTPRSLEEMYAKVIISFLLYVKDVAVKNNITSKVIFCMILSSSSSLFPVVCQTRKLTLKKLSNYKYWVILCCCLRGSKFGKSTVWKRLSWAR